MPTKRTKGVLVFPTTDGKVVAGPTAVDQEDKDDWSVRPEAWDEILPQATAMYPPLDDAEPIAAYAGLRPAGRGVNYAIGPSGACPGLVNVAAIRSTGLTRRSGSPSVSPRSSPSSAWRSAPSVAEPGPPPGARARGGGARPDRTTRQHGR